MTSKLGLTPEEIEVMLDSANDHLGDDGLLSMDAGSKDGTRVRDQRRTGSRLLDDDFELVSLVEQDGLVYWSWDSGPMAAGPTGGGRRGPGLGPRRGRAGWLPFANILSRRKFKSLRNSLVIDHLIKLDRKLTPQHEEHPLRQWKNGKLVHAKPVETGKILLFIHGTFSNCDSFLNNLQGTEDGKYLLAKAGDQYDQILTFDHPTLSVSPGLNGMDLAHIFAGSKAAVDMVCHSRGGLVTRWFCEHFDWPGRKRRVVLVGSPMTGTSLATPSRSRAVLDMMANFSVVAGNAFSWIPFLTVASGLLKLVSLTGKMGLPDMMIAMIPGLAGMSRLDPKEGQGEGSMSMNPELMRLDLQSRPERQRYFVIKADHQPQLKAPTWRIWQSFTNAGYVGLDRVADHVIFQGSNDLVVDTDSMVGAGQLKPSAMLDFGQSSTVHHCNYFEQRETLTAIRKWLEIED